MLNRLILIAAAGGLGTLARYALGILVRRLHGGDFPLSTLVVNAIGCFLFGLVWALAEGRIDLHPELRTVALVGFMGAFTTFSTFMFETSDLLQEQQYFLALGNITAHNAIGLVFLFAGLAGGRLF